MPRPRRYKAQAFDILQYFYGTAHEPVIHCRIRCAGTVDASILKKAVTLSMDAVPLIRCCFDDASRRPRWLERPFSGEDVVHAVDAGSDEAGQINSCLTSAIDIRRSPQLSIYLVKGNHNADTLCVIMNHMICDGAGFNDYLYLLAELYTGLERDAEYSPELQSGPRNAGQLFAGMNMREKLKILFSKYAIPAQERQTGLNLEGNNNDPFIATRRIEPENFRRIKAYAKNASSTVNDMALTAYVRLLSRKTASDRIILPCPVDLRRYIRGGRKCSICNLTSNLFCDVSVKEKDSFRDTLAQITHQMTAQKESTVCLKSIIMLEFVCRALSFRSIRNNFDKIFKIPVISYTNLGVIDAQRIRFGTAGADDVFITGAIKYIPYFQLAVSTFNGACTLSCNMHGTEKDRVRIEDFLEETARELAEIPSPQYGFAGRPDMTFKVFYFSGTGNTKWAAQAFRDITENAGNKTALYSIDENDPPPDDILKAALENSDMLGLATPIIGADVPAIMKRFIKRLTALNEKAADPRNVFFINTFGYVNGCGPFKTGKYLADGFKLSAYINIRLCNNISTPERKSNRINPEQLVKRKLRAKKKLAKLSERLAAGRRHIRGIGPYLVPGVLIRKKLAGPIAENYRSLSVNMQTCTRCMTCVEQCPSNSIRFEDDAFTFSPSCTTCSRCYNFCPAHAIQWGGVDADPDIYRRYRGPDAL